LVVGKEHYPAVTIVKWPAVKSLGRRFHFYDRGFPAYVHIGDSQSNIVLEHPVQPLKGTLHKITLTAVIPRERMGTHHGPVNMIAHMSEKQIVSARFQISKQFPNVVGVNWHQKTSFHNQTGFSRLGNASAALEARKSAGYRKWIVGISGNEEDVGFVRALINRS
jgi:hypothetical protein